MHKLPSFLLLFYINLSKETFIILSKSFIETYLEFAVSVCGPNLEKNILRKIVKVL